MSQTTVVEDAAITNPHILKKAVEMLIEQGIDCKLHENLVPTMYFQRQSDEIGVCDYVLRMKKCKYDVGFKFNGKNFDIYYDDHDKKVRNVIGRPITTGETAETLEKGNISKLKTAYSVALLKATVKKGHSFRQVFNNKTKETQIQITQR